MSGAWRLFPVLLTLVGILMQGAATRVATAADNQLPQGVKFAIVDMQKVLREATAIKTIRPQMEKLESTYQAKFKKYQEDLQAENEDLQRQRTILSPDAYRDRQTAFKKRVNERQREVQWVRDRLLPMASSVARNKVLRALYEITSAVAKERSLNLVMRKSGLLFIDPEYDISEEVVKRLNKKLPTVDVVLPKGGNPRDEEATQN